jgi:S-(hydroxymethyl)mycothiol dehydrogenase
VDRGLILAAPGEVRLEEIAVPEPGPGEVRVRIRASGVCHSDLHAVEHGFATRYPLLLGHEGAGEIDAVGEGVDERRLGERVVLGWRAPCGACAACTRGEPRRCERPRSARRRLEWNGEKLNQFLVLGTFADRTIVHADQAIALPTELPVEQACLLGCAVATGVGSVLNTAQVWPGARVAVIGCGGVGLSVVQGARIADAAAIHAVDLDPRKQEQALRFGATTTGDALDGEYDFVFDVVGAAPTFTAAVAGLAHNGVAVLVGVPNGGAVAAPLDHLFDKRARIVVSYGGDHLPAEDFPLYARLALEGRLDLAAMVTKEIALDQVEAAFDDMRRGDVIRSVIRP